MYRILTLVLAAALFVSPAIAEEQPGSGDMGSPGMSMPSDARAAMGQTTPRDQPQEQVSGPCPFTCNSQGYSHWGCQEWRQGDTCYIGPRDQGRVSRQHGRRKEGRTQ